MKGVELIKLKKILDNRGNLSIIESEIDVPFNIKRAYWIYDVPGGEVRGGHSFIKQKEIIVALSGSFDVLIDDGVNQKTYQLNRSYIGLYVPNKVWRQMKNFSTNSVALVLSSTEYDKNDYVYDVEKVEEIK